MRSQGRSRVNSEKRSRPRRAGDIIPRVGLLTAGGATLRYRLLPAEDSNILRLNRYHKLLAVGLQLDWMVFHVHAGHHHRRRRPATSAPTNVVGARYFSNLYRFVLPLLPQDVCRAYRMGIEVIYDRW